MQIFLDILQFVSLFIMCSVLFFLVRNRMIFRDRRQKLEIVALLSKLDAYQGYEWEWRFDGLEKANYHEMVIKFWRPLDSFYDPAIFDESHHKMKIVTGAIPSPFVKRIKM